MSISKFFAETLGAKLKNTYWSWGAYDSAGRLFLRVWDSEIEPYGDGERIVVALKTPRRKSNGYPERRRHVEALGEGVECYGVVCTAVSYNTDGPRKIRRFDDTTLLRLGELSEGRGRFFARIAGRISVDEIIAGGTTERELADDLAKIIREPNTNATTKETLVDARLGQGKFRRDVIGLWGGCCSVCGSSTLAAIRASHIKPWRDSTNDERLDPNNGLPLVASFDALFDAGLISFEASGRMLVSSKLKSAEQTIFGLGGKSLTNKPSKETAKYLRHHRTEVFQA